MKLESNLLSLVRSEFARAFTLLVTMAGRLAFGEEAASAVGIPMEVMSNPSL